jgi:D-ribose pyranose/furanose isomerase RbsD
MKYLPRLLAFILATSLPGLAADWRSELAGQIPRLGHRNWIVIADSAYPLQIAPGIQTVVTGADHLEVVQAVLAALAKTKHVRPLVYTDAELRFVAEAQAPGIEACRQQLLSALGAQTVQSLPHEQIIGRLDEAGKTYRVLLLKTNLTLPYTSVFLQLDCGYWSAGAEAALRAAMKAPPR